MLLSAPNAVPPTPPVGEDAPELMLIARAIPCAQLPQSRLARGSPLVLGAHECALVGQQESVDLIGGFFDYNRGRTLSLRRLILAPPGTRVERLRNGGRSRAVSRGISKRSAGGGGGADAALTIPTYGATFGCSLGNIIEYLQGRPGLKGSGARPAEVPKIIKELSTQLQQVKQSMATMQGKDAPLLAQGLAALRIVGEQRKHMPELNAFKVDSRKGHPGAAFGATAAIVAVFGIMAADPTGEASRHFATDNSLSRVLACAEEHLKDWQPAYGVRVPAEHWASLQAERRAIERARIAAETADAACETRKLPPGEAVKLQLQMTAAAAFPSGGIKVDAETQAVLCEAARSGEQVQPLRATGAMHPPPPPSSVVPLSEISGEALVTGGADSRSSDDSRSMSSSSWNSVASGSSSGASAYSHVSVDSLDGVLVCPLTIS